LQGIEKQVINRIYGNGRAWAFCRNDFTDLGSVAAIDQALSRLAKAGRIRRVLRGLYDYPPYSAMLKKEFHPNVDQVANALARKFGWQIQVSGNAALNILRLSTQVPTQYLYHSTGPSRDYALGNLTLRFKKATLKDMGVKYAHTALLVQALKALNQKLLSEAEQAAIREHFSTQQQQQILKDARNVTSWVYQLIKTLFKDVAK